MIRVLIVDDSPTVRLTLQTILESDPQIKIVGYASNGREALDRAMQLRPDLITMDVLMPEMDGIDATRLIMTQCPTPIVVVTTHLSDPELEIGFQCVAGRRGSG
ncbi:MAG: response regulator [Anaerolineales bacterium]|nr:response regulator [Anaerolineales bacterium]